ncbi:uncharacterized protein DSM5745_06834 [Aspergillus mulundensis]|uniref:Uncharacterized protein n=1 Tax=Aspergillus mulundensis TaxID=1810919 RepID=A0A3D8RRZ1_9EURO|nr:hypothetical protein DSM5745_06834 [Aspergillus mulundensis]RDW76842.1 hypothetical protein DSM5745_06834 [Aspergillus mulundensis]
MASNNPLNTASLGRSTRATTARRRLERAEQEAQRPATLSNNEPDFVPSQRENIITHESQVPRRWRRLAPAPGPQVTTAPEHSNGNMVTEIQDPSARETSGEMSRRFRTLLPMPDTSVLPAPERSNDSIIPEPQNTGGIQVPRRWRTLAPMPETQVTTAPEPNNGNTATESHNRSLREPPVEMPMPLRLGTPTPAPEDRTRRSTSVGMPTRLRTLSPVPEDPAPPAPEPNNANMVPVAGFHIPHLTEYLVNGGRASAHQGVGGTMDTELRDPTATLQAEIESTAAELGLDINAPNAFNERALGAQSLNAWDDGVVGPAQLNSYDNHLDSGNYQPQPYSPMQTGNHHAAAYNLANDPNSFGRDGGTWTTNAPGVGVAECGIDDALEVFNAGVAEEMQFGGATEMMPGDPSLDGQHWPGIYAGGEGGNGTLLDFDGVLREEDLRF